MAAEMGFDWPATPGIRCSRRSQTHADESCVFSVTRNRQFRSHVQPSSVTPRPGVLGPPSKTFLSTPPLPFFISLPLSPSSSRPFSPASSISFSPLPRASFPLPLCLQMSANESSAVQGAPGLSTPSLQQHQGQDPASSMASASVAQAGVGGDVFKCEWQGCNDRLPNPEALYVSAVRSVRMFSASFSPLHHPRHASMPCTRILSLGLRPLPKLFLALS
jgi:hypothetical protein